jgi:hypothetical protein
VQGYYDALLEHAQNMAVYPDEYTILEEFMAGLPSAMLSRCFREHRLTVKSTSLEDWVGAAKEIERCDRTESYYKDRNRSRTMAVTPPAPKPAPKKQPAPKRGGYNRVARIDPRERWAGVPLRQGLLLSFLQYGPSLGSCLQLRYPRCAVLRGLLSLPRGMRADLQ